MARKEISSKIEIYKSQNFIQILNMRALMMNIIYNSYFDDCFINIYLLLFFLSLNLKPLFFPFFLYLYFF